MAAFCPGLILYASIRSAHFGPESERNEQKLSRRSSMGNSLVYPGPHGRWISGDKAGGGPTSYNLEIHRLTASLCPCISALCGKLWHDRLFAFAFNSSKVTDWSWFRAFSSLVELGTHQTGAIRSSFSLFAVICTTQSTGGCSQTGSQWKQWVYLNHISAF